MKLIRLLGLKMAPAGLAAILLLQVPVLAQQEVDPDHFDGARAQTLSQKQKRARKPDSAMRQTQAKSMKGTKPSKTPVMARASDENSKLAMATRR